MFSKQQYEIFARFFDETEVDDFVAVRRNTHDHFRGA
jgi:hypothetical protein